jgi:hypothetical protein
MKHLRLGPSFVLTTAVAFAALGWGAEVRAETYQVGPGKTYASLNDVQALLAPGDVVEVDGDATYPGNIHFRNHGQPDAPVIIRGIPRNGRRPVLSGGDEWTVVLHGNHYVLDGFEITGGPDYCVVHKAHDITIRNTLVRDCPNHGILGTDEESGSLTIEHCEITRCGSADRRHQLYIATDETMHPGSVFRLQFTYVHGGNGGNNVKSRAERNEIYYNWIEGAAYHGLDLIGPDGQAQDLAREDSDVVGNVIITTSEWQVARIGGDGTGMTAGRYRFVNNTFVLGPQGTLAIRMQEAVESLELHNNVFFKKGEGDVRFLRHSDPMGETPAVRGSHNWLQSGWTDVPETFVSTVIGTDPGFANLEGFDFRPAKGVTLVDKGTESPVVRDAYAMPNPLEIPLFVPPYRAWVPAGSQVARPLSGPIDIGAYEEGSPDGPAGGPTGGSGGGGAIGGTGGVGAGAPATTAGAQDDSAGCACRQQPGRSQPVLGAVSALLLGLLSLRRRSSAYRRDTAMNSVS